MIYDVLIIGSGPAALTAAVYTSRDNLKTLVLGGAKWGGQLMLTTTVDNYPGFPDGVMGPDLMELFKKQAGKFGAEIRLVDVTKVDFKSSPFKLEVGSGEQFEGKSVIVATGAETVWPGNPNEEKYIGRGISSCAPCDAFFFKGKKVVVVGGGDSAMEETLTLAKFASEVTIVHRRDEFRASQIMQDRALSLPNVKVIKNHTVCDYLGESKIEGVVLTNMADQSKSQMAVDGVFVAIGHKPNTKIFEGQLELDEKGYIRKVVSSQQSEVNANFQMQTSVPGVFVAGDVHDHHYKQAVTAAAFGCMSALEVSRWLELQTK